MSKRKRANPADTDWQAVDAMTPDGAFATNDDLERAGVGKVAEGQTARTRTTPPATPTFERSNDV